MSLRQDHSCAYKKVDSLPLRNLLVSCAQLLQNMTEILPLNIITPTGVKYRSYATSNATLADLRKVLIQDGIIEASTKFQVQDTVITPIGERFTKCKDISSFPGLVGVGFILFYVCFLA